MDRNTIIAIVLSVIVITVGMTVNAVLFPPDYSQTETVAEVEASVSSVSAESIEIVQTGQTENTEPFQIETEAYTVTFDPAGASVSSIRLNRHLESTTKEPVELVLKDSRDRNAFLLYFDDSQEKPLDAYFNYTINDSSDDVISIDFTQTFEAEGQSFEIVKRFAIPKAEEYLFRVRVEINPLDGSTLPFGSYTLGYDPQIGPYFAELSNNYGEYRRVSYREYDDKKTRNVTSFEDGRAVVEEDKVGWMAVCGKYFTVIGVPDQDTVYSAQIYQVAQDPMLAQLDSFYYETAISGDCVSDDYSYYIGPKLSSTLRLIPNYGVAIILLTILVKLIIHPISKKGMDSTAKMSALAPKVQELQTKYKDDPNALNTAMAKLYKEEGISPMGSCIPMLIQFPIFIALYGLLSTHYELRGAMFIPGWIPDLSVPDTIFSLPFRIPLLGADVHLLPIIYTASMIFSMKITQTTSTQSGQQGMMKFMTYGMPLIFFFILYNAPSGLLLYWTVMNFISVLQQVFVNKKKSKKYADEIQAREEAKINKYKTKKRK